MNISTSLATAFAVMGVAALGACGNGGTTTGTGGSSSSSSSAKATAASTTATSTTATTGTTASSSSAGTGGHAGTGGGSACSGATPVALTVLNFDSWCTVQVGTAAASGAASQTVCVADGAVTLDATANAGFQLGDWFGVTGDTGTGDPGVVSGTKSTAMVTASGATKCVSVCCPFTGGTGCPTTNQCP